MTTHGGPLKKKRKEKFSKNRRLAIKKLGGRPALYDSASVMYKNFRWFCSRKEKRKKKKKKKNANVFLFLMAR